MRHLRNLGNTFNVSLPTDESGYLGRECPNEVCKGYFKIVPGTGLRGVTDCHCPYCGHTAKQSEFSTFDQIAYAKSIVFRKVTDAIAKDLKSLEFESKPKGAFGIGLSLKVQPGKPHPIRYYREKALETHIECPACTLKYAVYGVFAFCPDCRQHNSIHILNKNLELVVKMLDIATTADTELGSHLIENSLEDCVSAFDGFGRELCRIHAKRSSDVAKTGKVSFQNLAGAKQNLSKLFNLDLSSGLTGDEWKTAVCSFQKRHLLSHKMGIVDDEYIRKSGDDQAVKGRKVSIGSDEVRELVLIVGKLAAYIFNDLTKKQRESGEVQS